MSYRVFVIPKKSGGERVITAPVGWLKKLQRKILKQFQRKIWISRKAHGFERGRGILSNASAHLGKRWILNMDVKDFFPSITPFGFSAKTQREINDLVARQPDGDNYIPANSFRTLLFYSNSLPQGAPTSPFLSNLYMREFDTQVQALVRKYVSDDIVYTRYADDLTFSSNSRAVERVESLVTSKLNTIKLKLNHKKTRLVGRGQRQDITGICINSGRLTISKKYRVRVRAIVYRAATGWVLTDKNKMRLMGMIEHIALCHPEEADRYRRRLLPLETVPERFRATKNIKMIKLKHKHIGTAAAESPNNPQTSTNNIRKVKVA